MEEQISAPEYVGLPSDYGFIKDGQVYLKAYHTFPERRIGEVKTTEENALQYFANRFIHIHTKVVKLLKDIEEATNKGSFLMKLIHLREQLETYDGLGDFLPLIESLNEAEAMINGMVVVNRHKNAEIKRALIQELIDTMQITDDWPLVTAKIKEIKEKWLKTGAVFPEDEEDIEVKFNDILTEYYTARKAHLEERQKLIDERVVKYSKIVDKIAAMTSDDINAGWAIKQVPKLKEEWRAVGPIPKLYFEPLILKFKDQQKRILRNLKNQKASAPRRAKVDPIKLANMERKKGLIKEAYELSQIDLREAFGRAKEMQEVWKNIGEVPDEKKNELNNEFNYACDRIFEMSYLMRNVYTRYRFFNSKSPIEQYSVKIMLLKEIIERDEEELVNIVNFYNSLNIDDKKDPEVRKAYNRMKTQERKLKVKNILLSEMQAQLAAF